MLYFLSKHLYLIQVQINIRILHAQCFNPGHNYDSYYVLHTCEVKVAQSYPTLCNTMDCTVLGILQARTLGWIAYTFSSGSSHPRNWTRLSCVAGRFFTNLAIRKTPLHIFSSVESLSCVQLIATPWTAACQASLSITNSQTLPKLTSTESVMPSNHLIVYHPLLPSIFPSIRVFSNESALCIRWPKYWSCSFNISPSSERSGLIPFRVNWLDLLAVQGTLKSLLQHHSSKASILWHSAFFIVQLSHPYMTTGKTTALTRWILIGKVMSLLLICYLGWS